MNSDPTNVSFSPRPNSQPITLIDMGSCSLSSEAIQRLSDVYQTQSTIPHSIPLQWSVIPFSLPCLSSLLPTPLFLPIQKNSRMFPCQVFTLFIEHTEVEDIQCIDINHLSKTEEKPLSETTPKEQLVVSSKGVRMIYTDVTEPSKISVTSPTSSPHLIITSLLSHHPTLVLTLIHTPFYLIVAQSHTFSQLMRSLLLSHKLAQAMLQDCHVILLPFTSTSAYLFFPAGTESASLSGFKEVDCSVALESSTTDLTHYWTYMIESMKNSNEPGEVPVSGVLPGDLCAYSLLRRLRQSSVKEDNMPKEELFLSELREKLKSANLEEAAKKEGNLHIGDVSMILRSQLEEELISFIWFMGSYRLVLGMLQEDIDWYLKRIESMMEEYGNEMNPHTLQDRILEILKGLLLSKRQLKEKYGIRMNPSVTQIRFREYLLQVLIRLCIL